MTIRKGGLVGYYYIQNRMGAVAALQAGTRTLLRVWINCWSMFPIWWSLRLNESTDLPSATPLLPKFLIRFGVGLVAGAVCAGAYLFSRPMKPLNPLCHLCPLCKTEKFKFICKIYKKILACHNCFSRNKIDRCLRCKADTFVHPPDIVYLA